MTQTLTQLPTSTSHTIGTIVGSVGHGIWLAATSSPWHGAVLCLFILMVMARTYRAIRWAPIASAGLDPSRRFAGKDRAAILSRAGARCERHSLLVGRCKETEKLHADHIHPHSKGGSTTVANGQGPCSRHNKQKAARAG
jgi:HNH endonuclease